MTCPTKNCSKKTPPVFMRNWETKINGQYRGMSQNFCQHCNTIFSEAIAVLSKTEFRQIQKEREEAKKKRSPMKDDKGDLITQPDEKDPERSS